MCAVAANLIRVTRPVLTVTPAFLIFYTDPGVSVTRSVVMGLNSDGTLGDTVVDLPVGALWHHNAARTVRAWVESDPLGVLSGRAVVERERVVDLSDGSVGANLASLVTYCGSWTYTTGFMWQGDGYVYWIEIRDDNAGGVTHRSDVDVRFYLRRCRLDGSAVEDVAFYDWPLASWPSGTSADHFSIAGYSVESSTFTGYFGFDFNPGGAHLVFMRFGHGGGSPTVAALAASGGVSTAMIDGVAASDGYAHPSAGESTGAPQRLWLWPFGAARSEQWDPGASGKLTTLYKSGTAIEMLEHPMSSTSGTAYWIRGTTTVFSERIALPQHLGFNPSSIARRDA